MLSYIVVFLSLAIGSQLSDAYCPRKYRKIDGSCYHFGDVATCAQEARERCNSLNGYLVNIDNEEEYHTIINVILQSGKVFDGYWTGATFSGGNFVWETCMNGVIIERPMYPYDSNNSPVSMSSSVWFTMQSHFAIMIKDPRYSLNSGWQNRLHLKFETTDTGISYICETDRI